MINIDIPITQELLLLIAEIDEFKGKWRALNTLAPDRLAPLRKIATIESVVSSTRIEGAKLLYMSSLILDREHFYLEYFAKYFSDFVAD